MENGEVAASVLQNCKFCDVPSGIANAAQPHALNIRPSGELYVSLTGIEDISSIRIEFWNTIGQKVKYLKLNPGINTININEFLSGIYYYAIYINGVRNFTGKQIIIK